MVHWLGEGTNVMICLAREAPATDLDGKSGRTAVPSSVYISYDYGDTFEDKTNMFNIEINGTEQNSTLDQFMTHPNFSTVSLQSPQKNMNKYKFLELKYGR